jgi:hypothetical protein
MNHLFPLLFLTSLFFTKPLNAQPTPIQLDRPDQTECPFIVPTNFIQIENGFNYENENTHATSVSYPSTLWKFGLNEKSEFRLITEALTTRDDSTTSGFAPITLGFKTALWTEKGALPLTSFIGHITTADVGSKPFQTRYIAPSFRFTMQHTLSDKISLAYNLGAQWDGETPVPTYVYTLTTGFSITEQFGSYVELYGFLPADQLADHRFDCGFTYLINNNLMADLSGGFGITENAPDNYLSAGISYRFSLEKK